MASRNSTKPGTPGWSLEQQVAKDGKLHLIGKTLTGQTVNVYVDGDDPVEVIRHKVGKALGKPAESVRIIFAGRQLPSELAIMWGAWGGGSTFHIMFREGAEAGAGAGGAGSPAQDKKTDNDSDKPDKAKTTDAGSDAGAATAAAGAGDAKSSGPPARKKIGTGSFQLFGKLLTGELLEVCVDVNDNVEAIWRLVADALGRSPDDLRLIFAGAKVERDSPIKRHGWSTGATFHILVTPPKPQPAGSEKTAAGAAASAGAGGAGGSASGGDAKSSSSSGATAVKEAAKPARRQLGEGPLHLIAKLPTGELLDVHVQYEDLVEMIMHRIADALERPFDDIRILYAGRSVLSHEIVNRCGWGGGCTFHVLFREPAAAEGSGAAAKAVDKDSGSEPGGAKS